MTERRLTMKGCQIARAGFFFLFLVLLWHGLGPATSSAVASTYLDGTAVAASPILAGGVYYHHPYGSWRNRYYHGYPHYWYSRRHHHGYPYWYWRKWRYPYWYGKYSYYNPGVYVRTGNVGVGVFPGTGVFVNTGGVNVGVGPRVGVRVRVGP
jgi:hypothetical protein